MTQLVQDDDGLFTIEQEIAELEAKKKAILQKRRTDDLVEAKKLIQLHGFTAKELGLSVASSLANTNSVTLLKDLKVKAKLPPKYRNPSNQEQTWSGKGRPPEWFDKYVSVAGQTKAQLLIEANP
ncbi:MAG TPA: H-NS histone family protein [Azonexus sp.]|nr:H-NS histone family protein [Azonexus sp.]